MKLARVNTIKGRSKGGQLPVNVLLWAEVFWLVVVDAVVGSFTTVLVVTATISLFAVVVPAVVAEDEFVTFFPASCRITAALLGLGTMVAGRVMDLVAFTFDAVLHVLLRTVDDCSWSS